MSRLRNTELSIQTRLLSNCTSEEQKLFQMRVIGQVNPMKRYLDETQYDAYIDNFVISIQLKPFGVSDSLYPDCSFGVMHSTVGPDILNE